MTFRGAAAVAVAEAAAGLFLSLRLPFEVDRENTLVGCERAACKN